MNFLPMNFNDAVSFQYRPHDSNTGILSNIPQLSQTSFNFGTAQNLISFPVTIPSNKPGDHQAVQIQMINPGSLIPNFQPKFQINPVTFTNSAFNPAGTPTIVTVAYNSKDSEVISNQKLSDGKILNT